MAIFKPLMLNEKDRDIKKLMTRLYLFGEDLRYTLSNLSLEDNLGKSVIDEWSKRGEKIREIQFSSDGMSVDLKDFESGMHTQLDQTREKIRLLVQKGGVVETMLTRMELYGEYITLSTGQIIIEAQNMRLTAAGDTYFSGDIVGGSINIKNRFRVDPQGVCYIDGTLTTQTLNPPQGVYANELEVFNDNDMVNTVTGNIQCGSAYIMDTLNCRKVRQTSDRRVKREIKDLERETALKLFEQIRPVQYQFITSGKKTVGCLAQDFLSDFKEAAFTRWENGYFEVAYNHINPICILMIQENEKRIRRLELDLDREEGKDVKL